MRRNMIDGINGISGRLVASGTSTPAAGAPKSSFADVLKESIEEVARLQESANQAVEDLAVGKTQDIDRVMTQVEMADMALKTLLAIRAKLMDAYNEIKNLGI
jgi:flagellar hook-basal body complex protein FliE